MNTQSNDILKAILLKTYNNQRMLALETGYSLGTVNKTLKNLISEGYIDGNMEPTDKAFAVAKDNSPKRAIILAAGYGMRMVPINTHISKGLIEIQGEPIIERIIKHLQEVEINEIYIVVGFLKEKYEYLIDKYNVKLIVNAEYSIKNNIHSVYKALSYLDNTYIVPSDIWCENNPFSKYELSSWYMVTELVDDDSTVRVNRKYELVEVEQGVGGNSMIGISYVSNEDAADIRNKIQQLCNDEKYNGCFWEEALYRKGKMILPAKVVSSTEYIEINTYEQLRDFDSRSNNLKSDAIDVICERLNVVESDITNITVLKKGMTNRSFLFECNDDKYIMRIPGEGTGELINRYEEAAVYDSISKKGICEENIYINPCNGYKITRYIQNSRVCDPYEKKDLEKCMKKLKEFHKMKLSVKHRFDIFEKIDYYESLWNTCSMYRDYEQTKENILQLKSYIEKYKEDEVLTHIDAVADNFMFSYNENGEERIDLIDWEYAGMQDPHVDIAMFAIYSLYEREQIDELIDIYFERVVDKNVKYKIYCYIAACGLLWSNWCEYKAQKGVEFGEYSLKQYRYAKEYYKIFKEEYCEL